jgi:hypothetical protein
MRPVRTHHVSAFLAQALVWLMLFDGRELLVIPGALS